MMMRRRRGFRLIDTIRYEFSDEVIEVYLQTAPDSLAGITHADGGEGTFHAKWGGDIHQSESLRDLRSQALVYLEAQSKLEWLDVIEIEGSFGHFRNQEMGFGFHLERYYVSSVRIDGKYLKAPRLVAWDGKTTEEINADEKRRKGNAQPFYDWPFGDAAKKFNPPCRMEKRGTIWLPYSIEAWTTLTTLQGQVNDARDRFMAFLANPKSLPLLEAKGREILRMLPAPLKGEDQP
jgi:hypothetical protein